MLLFSRERIAHLHQHPHGSSGGLDHVVFYSSACSPRVAEEALFVRNLRRETLDLPHNRVQSTLFLTRQRADAVARRLRKGIKMGRKKLSNT